MIVENLVKWKNKQKLIFFYLIDYFIYLIFMDNG